MKKRRRNRGISCDAKILSQQIQIKYLEILELRLKINDDGISAGI